MARIAAVVRLMPVNRLLVIGGVLFAAVAMACETPVYRYAMYRWQPTPYEVYFFHDADPDKKDQEVAGLLESFGRGNAAPANVVYLPVNLAEDKELASVPPDVKKAWEAREDKSLPAYFISTPYGAGLSFHQLDAENVKTLIESPARKSLAAQLETGKLGVFVLLTGEDEDETKQTQEIMQSLVKEVQSGKVSLYVSPAQDDAESNEEKKEVKANTGLGLMTIDRASQEEQWFVRSLLAMEPDLAAETRPMVFLVYGRARALLPYIGKGITRENLLREIEFVSGACSCTVKEQNPGVDLLVRYDWESAAAALAEKFGSEEGNESQFGPEAFFPELIIGQGAQPEVTEVAASDNEPSGNQDIIEDPAGDPASDLTAAADAGTEEVVVVSTDSPPPTDLVLQEPAPEESIEVASVPAVEAPPLPPPSVPEKAPSAFSSVWVVGGGIVVAFLVLFGLTFVVLRPQ